MLLVCNGKLHHGHTKGSSSSLQRLAVAYSGDAEDFSDDDELRVTEAELRDLLDLYDSNLPDPSDESDDPERKL